MVTAFNAATVAAEPLVPGVVRQRLITEESVKGTRVTIDRLTLAPDATARCELPATSLAWLHMLEGEATIKAHFYSDQLSDNHSAFLPAGLNATLSTGKGASLLYAEIADVGRVDPGYATDLAFFTVVDWTREPVFVCKQDARKRVALVSPELCQTKAMRAAMVIYPAGTAAPKYHHEGAESVIYVLGGHGTASVDQQSLSVKPHDVIHIPDRVPHYLQAAGNTDLRFLTLQVPGVFKTVWADPKKPSAWISTEMDIQGRRPAKDENERRGYAISGGGLT
jgi:quercetin dioxygenase-like cupin family protein